LPEADLAVIESGGKSENLGPAILLAAAGQDGALR
jgi:hypothetical protein